MSKPRPTIDAMVEVELAKGLAETKRRIVQAMESPRFLEDCMTRYKIGQAEYGHRYEWLPWPNVVFEGEWYTEVLDAAIYPAMQRVTEQLRLSVGGG